MSVCNKCMKSVNRVSKGKVQCAVCSGYFHLSCVNLTESEINFLQSSGRVWSCDRCESDRRKSRSDSDRATPTKSNLDELSTKDFDMAELKLLIDNLEKRIMSGQKQLEVDLGKSLNLCHEKLDENGQTVKNLHDVIKKQNEVIETLRLENLAQQKKINELAVRLDDCEQYSRSNTLEIFGIPESPTENVLQTVIDVGRALDVNISEDMVDVCHRLKRQSNRPTAGIVVRFVRRFDKERILERRKVKRNLTTRDLGLGMDNPVYINQSLSLGRRVLFAKARAVRRDFNYKFLWIDRTGKIKMRKDENNSVHIISCEDDLAKLSK